LPGPLTLSAGDEVRFARQRDQAGAIRVTEPQAITEVQPGQRILLDDGRLQLLAVRLTAAELVARVEAGGTLLPNKGVNLPDTPLTIPTVTERDRAALAVAASAGVDWVAQSFVRGPDAASELRAAAAAHGLQVPILAKIERPEAVAAAPAILEAFDGIMVARGDLGVEIALERVPDVQKELIRLARAAAKPVITATDMLDSMRNNPRPTRAEASDVANAIYDGTDAVMLSGETAVGSYPVEAVAAMDRIVRAAEAHTPPDGWDVRVPRASIDDRISHATIALAREVQADAVVTPTLSGRTARLVARHRPRAVVVAPVPHEAVLRQLALVWGLVPVPFAPDLKPGADRIEAAVRAAFTHGALQGGVLAVVLAGHPVEGGEHLPTLRVLRIGDGGQSSAP
jgi:pyruvate kinase